MASRSYDTPIRDRKAAATREAILRALAEVVVTEGVAEMSVQQVADRAGVSHRTVYRHFPDRQALLDALGSWVQQQLEPEISDRRLKDVGQMLAAVPGVFEQFDELDHPAAAMARISVAEDVRSQEHTDRTVRFRELLAPELAGLGDADAVFALLRHLLSAVTWWVARSEFELDGVRAGRAVATIIEAVVEQARGGGGGVQEP